MTIAYRLARAGLTGLLAFGLVVDAGAQSAPAPVPASAPALSLVVLGSGGPGATGRAGASYLGVASHVIISPFGAGHC